MNEKTNLKNTGDDQSNLEKRYATARNVAIALNLPSHPAPTTCAAGTKNDGLPSRPSCFDALGDLPEAERFDDLWDSDSVRIRTRNIPSAYARQMRCLDDDSWHFGYVRNWEPQVLTASKRTDHTEISRRRFTETEPATVESISRLYRLSKDGVSNTLRAGTDSARGAFTSPRPIHYNRLSPLSQHAPRHLSTSATWTSYAWTRPTLPNTGVFQTPLPAATKRTARGTGSISGTWDNWRRGRGSLTPFAPFRSKYPKRRR